MSSNATSAPPAAAGITEKHHFLLRKLHSLTGIVPLGAFFVEHMVSNFSAVGEGGAEHYNRTVAFLRGMPFVLGLEIFMIFLPLLFHGVLGMWIAAEGRITAPNYPKARNWMYVMQRATGVITFIFVVFHLLQFRFHSHEAAFETIAFQEVQKLFQSAFWFVAYLIGVAATAFHLGNGVPLFCISWGITVSPRAQKCMNQCGIAVGLGLFVLGMLSAFAFRA
ncbi:MAG: succinate dehydrogenase [Planctomycetes bacterium]|nr:succinate dehydrogenase [Planctomycetota bacterium]